MKTTSTPDIQLLWTQLGLRIGYINAESQREEILTAFGQMTWTETQARPSFGDRPAVGVVVNAVLHLNPLVRIGVAPLAGGRQLIGLENIVGARRDVIDLDAEAIYVLDDVARCLQVSPSVTISGATRHARNQPWCVLRRNQSGPRVARPMKSPPAPTAANTPLPARPSSQRSR